MITHWQGRGLWDDYARIRRDPLHFLGDVARSGGGLVQIARFPVRYLLVNNPALVTEALVEKSDVLVIEGGFSRGLARLIGDGILTNRGDAWRHSRTSLQPLFRHDALATQAPLLCAMVDDAIARWGEAGREGPLPLSRELLALSCAVESSVLFQYPPSHEETLAFADAVWTLQRDGMDRFLVGQDVLPWPSARRRRVEDARATLRDFAQRAVDAGCAVPVDEILSLLFAGTESPVTTVVFALRLLEQHPEWLVRLQHEAPLDDDVFGSTRDLLWQVLQETLRLFPAGWAFERRAAVDVTLGGDAVPKGSRLLFCPWLLHRDPRFWSDPERFDPGRFQAGGEHERVPRHAFLPFGAGPRSCIGARLAMGLMRALLRGLVRETTWRFEDDVDAEGSWKLRLKGPSRVWLTRRHGPSSSRTPPLMQTGASS